MGAWRCSSSCLVNTSPRKIQTRAPITVDAPRTVEVALYLPVFEKLSYTNRKEYCRWIIDARKDETRRKRLAKTVELLNKGIKTPR